MVLWTLHKWCDLAFALECIFTTKNMEPQEGCRPLLSKRRGQLSDVDELSVFARSSIKVYGQFDAVCVVKKDEKISVSGVRTTADWCPSDAAWCR